MADFQNLNGNLVNTRSVNQNHLAVEPWSVDTSDQFSIDVEPSDISNDDYYFSEIGNFDGSQDFQWTNSEYLNIPVENNNSVKPLIEEKHVIGPGWKKITTPEGFNQYEGRIVDKDNNVVAVTLTEIVDADGKTDQFIISSPDNPYQEIDAKTGWDMIAKPVPDIDKGVDFKDNQSVIEYLAKNPNCGLFADGANYTADELTAIGRGEDEPAGKFSAQDRAAARYIGSHRELYRDLANIKPDSKGNYSDTGMSLETFQSYGIKDLKLADVINYLANDKDSKLFNKNKSMTLSDLEKIANGTGDDYTDQDRKYARYLVQNPEVFRRIDKECGTKENGEITREDLKEFDGILVKSEKIIEEQRQAEQDSLMQDEYERRRNDRYRE